MAEDVTSFVGGGTVVPGGTTAVVPAPALVVPTEAAVVSTDCSGGALVTVDDALLAAAGPVRPPFPRQMGEGHCQKYT